jgi:hypothetical protein
MARQCYRDPSAAQRLARTQRARNVLINKPARFGLRPSRRRRCIFLLSKNTARFEIELP